MNKNTSNDKKLTYTWSLNQLMNSTMNAILKLLKNYVSTAGFLMLTVLFCMFSNNNEYLKSVMDEHLPTHLRIVAFLSALGLIIVYEVNNRRIGVITLSTIGIKEYITELTTVLERGRLISDVNSAFTEFKGSGKEHITGEYYIKEIMTLKDTRERLDVNSYTQNELEYLLGRIRHSKDV